MRWFIIMHCFSLLLELSQRSNVTQHRDRIPSWANDLTTH